VNRYPEHSLPETFWRFRSGPGQAHIPGVRIPAELILLARRQHGVVSLQQALDAGLSRAGLQRRVAAGQLERVGTHCLRFAGHPDSWHQALKVGLLDLGDGALVARRSAAALVGMDGFEEGPTEFLVPRSLRGRLTAGSVRSARAVPHIDRIVVDGLACTSGARTIVDAAADLTLPELQRAIDSALRLGLTSEQFLRRRLTALRHRGREGVRLLDRALDGAGGHSWLERRFLAVVRRAGLPAPRCQQVHRVGGRFVARTDFSWEERRTIAEVAGHATHVTREQRRRDAQRHAELSLLGWLVLTFTYEQVVDEPAAVIAILRRAFQARFLPPSGSLLA
jgi:very-short-patch-repair endonuclease